MISQLWSDKVAKYWLSCVLIWKLAWGRIFQAHSGCWQNSFPHGCKTHDEAYFIKDGNGETLARFANLHALG